MCSGTVSAFLAGPRTIEEQTRCRRRCGEFPYFEAPNVLLLVGFDGGQQAASGDPLPPLACFDIASVQFPGGTVCCLTCTNSFLAATVYCLACSISFRSFFEYTNSCPIVRPG